MGPVNWVAVVLAAAIATGVAAVWHGTLFRSARQPLRTAGRRRAGVWPSVLVFALAAIMLGHNFARIGEAVLAAKPWLYFMQTGGVAVFFVIPAVWLTQARTAAEPARRALDCACWLAAYLAMGLVFWALGS